MQERKEDLWSVEPADARVITTNGFVTSRGECVMGAGIAKEAKDRYPSLPALLGEHIGRYGNHVYAFSPEEIGGDVYVVAFPTKPATGPNGEPGFKCPSDPKLIRRSCAELLAIANHLHWEHVVLPRPGCGLGGLRWEDVRPWLADLLDDRFLVVSN